MEAVVVRPVVLMESCDSFRSQRLVGRHWGALEFPSPRATRTKLADVDGRFRRATLHNWAAD